MKKITFGGAVFLLVGGALILLVVILWAGEMSGMPMPMLQPASGEIGAYGPVRLVFQDAPRDPALAGFFSVSGPGGEEIDGSLRWQDHTAWWQPSRPLVVGQTYRVSLAAGVTARSGLKLRQPLEWTVTVRPPEVAYLVKVEAPDVWRKQPGKEIARQLTFTGGRVYDFTVSPSGEQLAYTAENGLQGLDLYETSRDGGETRLLVQCASDRCDQPVYTPDGSSLLYMRRPASGGGFYLEPSIWSLNLVDLQSKLLVDHPGSAANGLSISPDGKYLAFFSSDPGSDEASWIRIVDLESSTGFALPANGAKGGSWSPDSSEFWFSSAFLNGEYAPGGLYRVDLKRQEVIPVAWSADLVFLGPPAWSADGEWIAFSAGSSLGATGSQIWRVAPDGSGLQSLISEPFYRYGSYAWLFNDEQLVFQRLEQDIFARQPQVAVWQATTGEVTVLSDDSALPRWIP